MIIWEPPFFVRRIIVFDDKEWARDNFPVWRSDLVCICSFKLSKNAGIVVLFRVFVIEERAPKVGALGEDGLKMRCETGKLLPAHS